MPSATEKHASRELATMMPGRGGCESVQQMINGAVTTEAFAVTLLGVALRNTARSRSTRSTSSRFGPRGQKSMNKSDSRWASRRGEITRHRLLSAVPAHAAG